VGTHREEEEEEEERLVVSLDTTGLSLTYHIMLSIQDKE
jgi:hypothetical protein